MKLERFLAVLGVCVLVGGSVALVGCGDSGGGGGVDTVQGTDLASATDQTQGEEDVPVTADTHTPDPDVPCVPQCTDRECGDDGCGGTCAPGCPEGVGCTVDGRCVCVADCDGKDCGDDGCGGSCGTCNPYLQTCSAAGVCEDGPSDLTCKAFFGCQALCAGDETCAASCRDAVIETEVAALDAVEACFAAGCADCADPACRLECGATSCPNDYVACFRGLQLCHEVTNCVRNDCFREDPDFAACRAECLAGGTPDAQTTYLNLEDCIETACGAEPPDKYEECRRHAEIHQCTQQNTACMPN